MVLTESLGSDSVKRNQPKTIHKLMSVATHNNTFFMGTKI